MATPLTIISNASGLRAQSQSLYSNEYTDCSFVFEFLPMDVASRFTTQAVFEQVGPNAGFSPVDSVGTLNVSAVNFSRLFYIKTNDLDSLTDLDSNNFSYGVIGTQALIGIPGSNPFRNISFSNANIHSGFANPAIAYIGNTSLYQDYVRYTAKAITGGYALSDIFGNEMELLRGVGTIDSSFNTSFQTLLNNFSNCENTSSGLVVGDPGYPYVLSCKTLVANLLKDATSDTNSTRGRKFLSDLQLQSDQRSAYEASVASNTSYGINFSGFDQNTYWVIFQPGDVMAVRLTYSPQNGSGNPAVTAGKQLGSNKIYDRSYKIYLRMT
jgi:hypothetical protein